MATALRSQVRARRHRGRPDVAHIASSKLLLACTRLSASRATRKGGRPHRGERLGRRDAVREAQLAADQERGRKGDDKVDDEGRGDTEDGGDRADDLLALGGKDDERREEETDERERADDGQEALREKALLAQDDEEDEASDDGSGQGDAEEDGDTACNGAVADVEGGGVHRTAVAEDVDEQEAEWGVENDLKERVDGD